MSLDDVTAAAAAYGQEQLTVGAASRQPEVDALNAQVAQLQAELLAAQDATPVGLVEVAPGGDLQGALDKNTPILLRGNWPRTSTLLLPPTGDTTIWLADDAVLERDFDSDGGATRSALVGNRDWTKPIAGKVSIRGTGNIGAKSGRTGNVFSIWAQQVELLDFTTPYWVDGRWFFGGGVQGGECARIGFTCDPAAGSGTGGLRLATGTMTVHDMRACTAGDDLWGAVPAGNPHDPLFNAPDVHDALFANLRGGRSLAGRLCVEGLQDQADDGTTRLGMKSGVHGVRWEHIDGFSGKSAYVHQNKSSTGTITGTRTLDVVISRKYATAGQGGEIFVNGVPTTGGIDDVDLSGVTVIDDRLTPPNHPIFAQQGKVTNLVRPPQAA